MREFQLMILVAFLSLNITVAFVKRLSTNVPFLEITMLSKEQWLYNKILCFNNGIRYEIKADPELSHLIKNV